MVHQFKELIIFSRRLDLINRNEGTHETLSKVISKLNGMVLLVVIGDEEPVDKLTSGY